MVGNLYKGVRMDTIGSYLNVAGNDFYFSGCESCDKRCCDGKMGYALTPLIADDFAEVYKFFPIAFGEVNGVFRPLMILNDGNSTCTYLQENGQCGIYENRPPSCKLYPISPFFDEVYIDSNCPSVNAEGMGIAVVQEGKVTPPFYHQRLENFSQKLEQTSQMMQELVQNQEDFEPLGEVSGVLLYKYVGSVKNQYVTMHHESLLHLE